MSERQISTLRNLVVGGLWILIAATYPLWFGTSDFPQVPFFGFLTEVPLWLDYVLLVLLAAASFMLAWGRDSVVLKRHCCLAAAAMLALLTLLDQHRFQPWVYLAIVQLIIMSATALYNKLPMRLIRLVMCSIYIYSAISKFDHSFFQHLGMRFVDTFLDQIGMNPHLMTPAKKQWLIWLIPIGELLVGAGLTFPLTRRFAVGPAVVLHATLIIILGPWGLGHHLGVLIWNALFAAQVLIVFGWTPAIDNEDEVSDHSLVQWFAALTACICISMPIVEIADGPVDHWPAWSLYSDRTDKVELFLASKDSDRLPPNLLRHLGPPIPFQPWRKFYLEAWSLAETRAPIYPEDRFQLGVAKAIAERFGLADDDTSMKIILHDSPDRETGQRESTTLIGRQAIDDATSGFGLNTTARIR